MAKWSWNRDRIFWRLIVPFLSGIMAFFVSAMITAGIISVFNAQFFKNFFGALGGGFFIGYFSDNVLAALQNLTSGNMRSNGHRMRLTRGLIPSLRNRRPRNVAFLLKDSVSFRPPFDELATGSIFELTVVPMWNGVWLRVRCGSFNLIRRVQLRLGKIPMICLPRTSGVRLQRQKASRVSALIESRMIRRGRNSTIFAIFGSKLSHRSIVFSIPMG